MNDPAATGDWEKAASSSSDRPTLPGYEILDELGRGGMGVVYKARRVDSGQVVALKLIRDAALAGPQDRARFRMEADVVARIKHPHVVEIIEAGEHQGRLFFAMEFVDGGSLAQYLSGQPQSPAFSATLVRALALAIEQAHAQSIVHRDLKPANVLLQRAQRDAAAEYLPNSSNASNSVGGLELDLGRNDFIPKITDFGLAKILDKDCTLVTMDGAVLGTASYMSPEQASGRVGEVGPLSDVYALGAMLYELLTGRPPFLAGTRSETIDQVLRDEPQPISRLRPNVPRELETICLKCLEKEQAERYSGARALADDLGRFLAGRPVAAVPVSGFERITRLAARDGFVICEEIGRGPQSVVYRALRGPLKQPVALKVFSTGICPIHEWESLAGESGNSSDGATSKLLTTSLTHPNIVALHQSGAWEDSIYLAMEYVAQGSLATRLVGAGLSIRDSISLVVQVGEIVTYLHRQGIVHGNLKPTNVLLAANGIPRIVDFHASGGLFVGMQLQKLRSGPSDGCADEQSDDYSTNPIGLSAIGYLAPELLQDESPAEQLPHTDIYGLGILLYESLTGRPPFDGANATEMVAQVRTRDPEKPSRFNRRITSELDAFCLYLLRKDPWHRFARAFDVSKHLKMFLE